MSKKLSLLLIFSALIISFVTLPKVLPAMGIFTFSLNQREWLLPLIIVSALLDSINPCAFSILIITIAFLFKLGKDRGDVFRLGLAYIFGLYLIYLLIGLSVVQTLQLFGIPKFMTKLSALVLTFFGVVELLNHYFPSFPIRLEIPTVTHQWIAKATKLIEKSALPAAVFLGGLVGIFEFPCTGGPYLLVLSLLHDSATSAQGVGYLLIYNLIFVSPLLLILLIASDKSLLLKVKEWRKDNTGKMRVATGLIMALLGIALLLL